MSNIFISYSRVDQNIVSSIAQDIESLGHDVWFDKELSGGEKWWDQILSNIQKTDILVFILSSKSLDSVACNKEHTYAVSLKKPIIPVQVSIDFSTNTLPSAISQLHIINYDTENRKALALLSKSLTAVQPLIRELPSPLPDAPGVPISYLSELRDQIETTSTLSSEEQSLLLHDLQKHLRESGESKDSTQLLERLRKRKDLYAHVSDTIDVLLNKNTTNKENTSKKILRSLAYVFSIFLLSYGMYYLNNFILNEKKSGNETFSEVDTTCKLYLDNFFGAKNNGKTYNVFYSSIKSRNDSGHTSYASPFTIKNYGTYAYGKFKVTFNDRPDREKDDVTFRIIREKHQVMLILNSWGDSVLQLGDLRCYRGHKNTHFVLEGMNRSSTHGIGLYSFSIYPLK